MDYSISAKKNAYLFIIIVGILNTLIALTMYFYLKDSLTQSLYKKNIELAKLEFQKTKKEINKDINHYKLILDTLKNNTYFEDYIKNNENLEKKDLVEHDFRTLSKTNSDIFQIRYLDKKGLEKIRIDKINNQIIAPKILQDKSDRYYFQKTKSLKNNEFYISDFDLNIENGKIEIPYKPTIRVATPIFNNSSFHGILIINYNAQGLIDYIREKHIFNVYYMDDNRNFLLHPSDEKCWSSQLKTQYKVKDEIKNIDELIDNNLNDKNWIYYINKVSITDKDFFIIYSVKKEFYEAEEKQLKQEIFLIFFIIFLVTLPIVIVGSYLQTFQMKILETLIDSVPFPIVLKNKKGHFILINNALVKLYGFQRKEDLLGRNSYEFFSRKLPYSNKEIDKRVLSNKKLKFEDCIFTQNKKLFFDTRLVKITFLGLLNKDFILGIAIDITELKELNFQLEKKVEEEVSNRIETEKQLTKKVKLAQIGNLIDNIILQWEQPLNLISLSIQAIEIDYENDNINPKETLEKLNIIKNNTNLLFNTTKDFKVFLSLKNGIELFKVSDTILIIERILQGRLNSNYIKLENNVNEKLTLKGLKDEFSQVILNILSNSLDEFESTKKVFKEKVIYIKAYEKNNHCYIKIKDTAGGIQEEFIDKIFENKFTSKNKEALGIGLSISKEIIEDSFKGKIKAYNEDFGAVIEIEIPLS